MRIGGAIMVGLLAMGLSACERSPAPPADQPATQPAAKAPATRPISRLPAVFVISQPQVGDRAIEFPPARLVLKASDNHVHASLFSDDPPEAIRDGYAGNSFYFEADFDVAADELPGREHLYRNSENERAESNTGLFLFGARQVLQPLDAALHLETESDQLVAYVAGRFRVFDDADPDHPATVVMLRARIVPEVVMKK